MSDSDTSNDGNSCEGPPTKMLKLNLASSNELHIKEYLLASKNYGLAESSQKTKDVDEEFPDGDLGSCLEESSSCESSHSSPKRTNQMNAGDVSPDHTPEDDDNIEIKFSQKGKELLLYRGYSFLKEKVTATKTFWCCQQKRYGCRARIHTTLSSSAIYEILQYTGDASHADEPSAVSGDVSAFIEDIKQKAIAQLSCPPSQIINEATSTNNKDFSCLFFPGDKSSTNRIHYASSKLLSKIVEPKSFQDIKFGKDLKVNGEKFLLAKKDFGKSGNFLMMGTGTSIKMLSISKSWFMDGTIRSSPTMFRQLFSIHGSVNGEIVPLIFVLMSKKTKLLYEHIFRTLVEISKSFNVVLSPKYIQSDFEKGISLAAKKCFPNARYSGCYFHLVQILIRRISIMKLKKHYAKNRTFFIHMQMIRSMAYLDPEDVPTAVEELTGLFEKDEKSMKVLNWFKKYYVSKSSDFGPSFWCINSRLHHNLPVTANNVEGWHHRLNILIGFKNPGVLKLGIRLKEEFLRAQKIATTGNAKNIKGPLLTKKKAVVETVNLYKSGKFNSKCNFLLRMSTILSKK